MLARRALMGRKVQSADVEDRVDAGLWMEMTDLSVDEYSAKRLPDVLDLPGVERGGCWENANRDRTDLPRKLPEFSLLGLYEVDDGFEAPPLMPEGVTGRELADRLRKQNPALKVIFMSGYSPDMAGKDTELFRKTRTYFLQKPCSSRLLVVTIRRCLDEK